MNMAIDAGNSLTKIGIFEGEQLKERKVFASIEDVEHFVAGVSVANLILGSVAAQHTDVVGQLRVTGVRMTLTHALPVPITNAYATPETLGVDRLAAACGARLRFPEEASLVIDIGTCINYEFIDAHGTYRGGAISPGITMRFQSMHQFTHRLPVSAALQDAPLTGSSTVSCLQSGVMNGLLAEMEGIADRYRIDNPGIRVILTGGDAHFFEILMKPSIFVAPDLVLEGLNSILMHNVNR
ncbi:MAG: type III pantothenate kinase [Cytophagales bacterium]|nr:type III pantothenate kinase [Cytophagales bacterium]